MLFVCLLIVVCSVSFAVRGLRVAVCCLLFVVCCVFVVCCLWFVCVCLFACCALLLPGVC